MKKFLATLFAAALAVSVSAGAFAATALTENPAKGKAEGEYTIDVQGRYQAGTSTAGDVISADIAWEGLTFTYTAESKGTWNASTHSYNGGTDGAWSTNKGEITVTNHSNVGLEADFTFTGKNGITGTFTKNSVSVESADNAKYQTAINGVYPAPSASTEFGINSTSEAISANGSIGTITVNLAKEVWTEVSTESELKNALAEGGNIKLVNNIALANTIEINTPKNNNLNIVLDLNGYAITEVTNANLYFMLILNNHSGSSLKVTIKDTSPSGTGKIEGICECGAPVRISNSSDIVGNNAEIVLESGIISGFGALSLGSYTKAIINGGKLIGNNDDPDWYTLQISGEGSSVVINGGTITTSKDCNAICSASNSQTLTITGGMMTGYIYIDESSPAAITITGGTFSFDPSMYVDTDNYTVTANDDSTWTVNEK